MPPPCSLSMQWSTRSIKSKARVSRQRSDVARRGSAFASPVRAGINSDLSVYAFAADWISLSPSSDVFGIFGRSDGAFRIMGRRLDDACKIATLSFIRHFRLGLCSEKFACEIALVFAVALWSLARSQRTRRRLILVHRLRRAERFNGPDLP